MWRAVKDWRWHPTALRANGCRNALLTDDVVDILVIIDVINALLVVDVLDALLVEYVLAAPRGTSARTEADTMRVVGTQQLEMLPLLRLTGFPV